MFLSGDDRMLRRTFIYAKGTEAIDPLNLKPLFLMPLKDNLVQAKALNLIYLGTGSEGPPKGSIIFLQISLKRV